MEVDEQTRRIEELEEDQSLREEGSRISEERDVIFSRRESTISGLRASSGAAEGNLRCSSTWRE
jgi:hypothetical protein